VSRPAAADRRPPDAPRLPDTDPSAPARTAPGGGRGGRTA